MNRLLRAQLLTSALSLCPSLALAQAQATTAVIEGTVSDPTGASVSGASVNVKNTATNLERSLTTDADGRFRALLLPLGPYRVTVTQKGFATLVRAGIELTVGQSANLALSLKVSTVQEEIVVQADSPVIETTRAEGADRINQAAIRGLPNNGRNFLDFAKLTPGVSIVQGPDGDEMTVNGQKGIHNNVSVDGADFNNPFFGEQRGGQRPAFTFNLDAVQEVVVVAEGANAEFGRSSGGFVNVVTKSGTNDVHGTVHAYFKDDALSSPPKNAGRLRVPPSCPSPSSRQGSPSAGPSRRTRPSTSWPSTTRTATRPSRRTRTASSRGWWTTSRASAAPTRTRPIDRTNDARVFLAKVDWQASNRHVARCATPTPGPSSRTERSTWTPGARAPTRSRRTTPTR